MINVKAQVNLYDIADGRTIPFYRGYRPLFMFIKDKHTSGAITLIKKNDFFPGESQLVEIKFLHRDLLGEKFGIGTKFTFSENGRTAIGDGEILEVLSW